MGPQILYAKERADRGNGDVGGNGIDDETSARTLYATIFLTTPCYLREPARVNHTYAICPTIHPKEAFANQTYRGKVVSITGTSRGIEQETAITYAKADAQVTLVGCSQETLDETAAAMRAAVPEAQVLAVPADATLERFGRLIANAGAASDLNQKLGDKDPERWWNTLRSTSEVFSTRFERKGATLVSTLEKTSGRIVATSSVVAQLCASDYAISKHAVNRLLEFISLVFALHPGYIKSQLSTGGDNSNAGVIVFDALYGKSVRYFPGLSHCFQSDQCQFLSSNWNLGEVVRDWKEKVQVKNTLVNNLAIPE
ncbi:NAD-P-binding protein [Lactarius deliciosus]|nr:NAD-P-binding protein [Lactarius deliciosus]